MIGKCPYCELNRKLFVCRCITDIRCIELFRCCIYCANRRSLVIIAEAQEVRDGQEHLEGENSGKGLLQV